MLARGCDCERGDVVVAPIFKNKLAVEEQERGEGRGGEGRKMMEILYIVLRKDVEVMQISFLLWIENDVAKLISHDQPPARRTDAAPHLPYVPGRNDKLEVDLGTVLAAAGFEADTAATATVLLLLEGRPGGRLGWVEDYTAGQEHMQDKGLKKFGQT